MKNNSRTEPTQLVKSVNKSFNILEKLIDSDTPMGVTEISKALDINKSTVYRLLATLEYRGYVEQESSSEKYKIGMKLFEIGSKAINSLDLRNETKPYLMELMKKTEETIHMGILDDNQVVYIEKVESPKMIRMHSQLGHRMHAHSTSMGKVLMAYTSENKVNEIIEKEGLVQYTENTITEPEKLKKHLKKIRNQGYAIDDQENEYGIKCVSGPIFDHNGGILSAFSISVPIMRLNKKKFDDLIKLVKEYSKKISKALGYNGFRNEGIR